MTENTLDEKWSDAPEPSANQMITGHIKVCAGCRAIFESDPNQKDPNAFFRKFHDQRRREA